MSSRGNSVSQQKKQDMAERLKNKAKFINSPEESIEGATSDYGKMFSGDVSPLKDKESDYEEIPLKLLVSAPEHWNFYKPLDESKMLELMQSIEEIGLQNPIIVSKDKDTYTILAGHNRKMAFQRLEDMHGEEYSKIPARVYKSEDINDNIAQQIVIDTNWVQRELTKMEKAKSIIHKKRLIEERRASGELPIKGRTRDLIASYFNVAGRHVDRFVKLANLIPSLGELIDSEEIPLSSGFSLSALEPNIQKWIYENFRDKISSGTLTSKIKPSMSKPQIEELLTGESSTEKAKKPPKITIKVKQEKYEDFLKELKIWIVEREYDDLVELGD